MSVTLEASFRSRPLCMVAHAHLPLTSFMSGTSSRSPSLCRPRLAVAPSVVWLPWVTEQPRVLLLLHCTSWALALTVFLPPCASGPSVASCRISYFFLSTCPCLANSLTLTTLSFRSLTPCTNPIRDLGFPGRVQVRVGGK